MSKKRQVGVLKNVEGVSPAPQGKAGECRRAGILVPTTLRLFFPEKKKEEEKVNRRQNMTIKYLTKWRNKPVYICIASI